MPDLGFSQRSQPEPILSQPASEASQGGSHEVSQPASEASEASQGPR